MTSDKETAGWPVVRLKNGQELDAARALTFWEALQLLHQRHPNHFQTLLALAEGRRKDVQQEHLPLLRQSLLLGADREILPPVQAVLLAAYLPAPNGEGIVLRSPIHFASKDEARAIEELDEKADKRFIRELFKGDGPGRGS